MCIEHTDYPTLTIFANPHHAMTAPVLLYALSFRTLKGQRDVKTAKLLFSLAAVSFHCCLSTVSAALPDEATAAHATLDSEFTVLKRETKALKL
jgi:hypothetical protein